MKSHGISVGLHRYDGEFLIVVKAFGVLTHEDYQVLTPMLENFLAQSDEPNIRMLFDAREFEGWELHAAWDDFKIGLKHGSQFGRIALLGNQAWQKWASKIGSWFISGEVQSFEYETEAIQWLKSS